MEKLKKATKRITAVAASAVMISSAAFGAGLGSYPSNFVQDNEFNGKIVVGASAATIDTTASMSIIEDLKAQFAGETEQVRITYRKSTSGGETMSAIDDQDTLNYGDTLSTISKEFDDGETDLLEDGDLDGDDYTQELVLKNGKLDYRIFDELDEEEISGGIFYSAGQAYAEYTLDFSDNVDVDDADAQAAIKGETMIIMGNEFTVVDIDDTELTLIGGSNKVSLGEGETTTVTVEGESYEISIQSVGDEKVLLTINGVSKSIEEYEVEDIAGVTLAVTDLVSSSRDSVKGYAEIVIGGQKVELSNSGIKINDEDLDDVYDDYDIDVTMTDTAGADATKVSFEGFKLTYNTDIDVVLHEGDSIGDVIFDTFNIVYQGTNDVEYKEFVISTETDEITFGGDITLHDGNELPDEFKLTTDDSANNKDLYLGSDRKRIYFSGSDTTITNVIKGTDYMEGIDFLNSTYGTTTTTLPYVAFNVSLASSDIADNMLFSYVADDEFYLYEIASVDKDDLELDFKELIDSDDTNGVEYDDTDLNLESVTSAGKDVLGGNWTTVTLASLGTAEMRFENDLMMVFTNAEDPAFTSTGTGFVNFYYNTDIDVEDATTDDLTFKVEYDRATDYDGDAIELTLTKTAGTWATDAEETVDGGDFDLSMDAYGTQIIVDSEDKDDVTIRIPDEEVIAEVDLVFGGVASETGSVTVDADQVEDKKAELEEEGYTITGTETLSSEEVTFDVEAPITDSEVVVAEDLIVVGGPAVNAIARELLGIGTYTIDQAGVMAGEGVIRYFEDANTVLVYGYDGADTAAAVARLNDGGLSGDQVDVQ